MTKNNKLYVILTPLGEIMKMSVADNEQEAWRRACLLTQSNGDLLISTTWFARCWRACGGKSDLYTQTAIEIGDLHTQTAIEIGALMGYRIYEAEVTLIQSTSKEHEHHDEARDRLVVEVLLQSKKAHENCCGGARDECGEAMDRIDEALRAMGK